MATAQHHAGAPGWQPAEGSIPGQGLVTFGAVMLGVLALLNGLDGIAAINRSHVFTSDAHYVFGDLRAWGWAMLALAIAQGFAVLGILARVPLARWFGVAMLGLNAFAQMAFVPSYPAWSILIIALDVVAIYGLVAYGGPVERADASAEGAGPPR
jgi:hypothetical protein